MTRRAAVGDGAAAPGAASAAARVAVETAPAKLNLGLRVLGRRRDGFHDLDSLFVRLDLADVVTLRAAPAGARVGADAATGDTPADAGSSDRLDRLRSGDAWLDERSLSLGPDNLVLRALAGYRRAAAAVGVEVPAVEVDLVKRIPWGAGLAGGSADAAAALRAVATLWPADVDLPALGAALGSDVPFCLAGTGAARVGGRGEHVVPFELPPLDVLLVYPAVEVATAAAFGWWASAPVDVPAPDDRALRAGERVPLHNALEGAVAARVPAVAEAIAELRTLGLGPVAMSGSGSTCFALAADAAATADAARALARRRKDWWVRAVRSV